MNKKQIVVLTLTLSCLFSIIGVRIKYKSIVATTQCIIHSLPSSTIVLLNTATGVIGNITSFPTEWVGRFPLVSDGITLTPYYVFECQYPDFTITADSGSRQAIVEIPMYCISQYNHDLAAQFLCSTCLDMVEQSNPSCNLLLIANANGKLSVRCIDEVEQSFDTNRHHFVMFRTLESDL